MVTLHVCVLKGVYCQPTGQCLWHAVTSWRPCSAANMPRPGVEWCPSTVSPRTPSCLSWSISILTPAVLVSLLHKTQTCTTVTTAVYFKINLRLNGTLKYKHISSGRPKNSKTVALPSSLSCGLIKPCSRFYMVERLIALGNPQSVCYSFTAYNFSLRL